MMGTMFTSADGSIDLRVSAYAVVTDEAGRLLLPHWSEGGLQGWTMPGGDHDAVDAEQADQLHVIAGLLVDLPDRGHPADRPGQALRIVYRARVTGGDLRVEEDGSTDGVAWHTPAEVDALDRVALVDTSRRWAGLIP